MCCAEKLTVNLWTAVGHTSYLPWVQGFSGLWRKAGQNLSKPDPARGIHRILEETFKLPNRDPYIVHLNIALSMVVSLYFGGKSHASNGQNVSLKEPCQSGMI